MGRLSSSRVGPGDTAVPGGAGPGLQCSRLGTRSCPSTMGVSPICAPQARLHHLPRFPTGGTGSARAQTTLGTAGWPAPCPSGPTTGTSLSAAQPSVRTYVLTGAHAPGARAACIPVPRAGKHIVGHDMNVSCPKVEKGGFTHKTGYTPLTSPSRHRQGRTRPHSTKEEAGTPPPPALPRQVPPGAASLPFPSLPLFVKDQAPRRPGRTACNGAPARSPQVTAQAATDPGPEVHTCTPAGSQETRLQATLARMALEAVGPQGPTPRNSQPGPRGQARSSQPAAGGLQ